MADRVNKKPIKRRLHYLYHSRWLKAFTAGVMIFIEQFWAIWPWSIGVLEFWLSMSSSEVPASSILRIPSPRRDVSSSAVGDIFRSVRCRCVRCRGSRGEGILRMEDAGTSEEDDIDSQDSNTPIDHGHLARNCSINIITPAVKASVSHLIN